MTAHAPIATPAAIFPGRFASKVAIVTGAAQGIGRAVAERLAAEGGKVVAGRPLGRSCEEVRPEAGGAAGHRRSRDLGGRRGGRRRRRSAPFGRHRHPDQQRRRHDPHAAVRALTPRSEIEAEIRRSLFPTLWCCRAVLPAMRGRRGVIVNVSSIATRGVHRIPYSAAKGGVNALTASLALEAAARGIRVVATAPGGTEAPPAPHPARAGRRRPTEAAAWYRGGRRPDQGVEPAAPLRHRRRTGGADPVSRIRRGLLRHRRHPAGVGRRPRVSPRGDRSCQPEPAHAAEHRRKRPMTKSLDRQPRRQALLDRVAGVGATAGDPRVKRGRPPRGAGHVPRHRGPRHPARRVLGRRSPT